MSLFDVIKYPISDPPTEAEIDALPDHITDKIFLLIIEHPKTKKIPDYKNEIIHTHMTISGRPRMTVQGIKKFLLDMP